MGWIIAAAIAVLVIVLLVVPIALHIRYDGTTTRVWLRILLFKFLISDSSKPKKENKKKEKNGKKEKPKQKKSFFEIVNLITDIARSGIKAGRIAIKHLRFYGVRVYWRIARNDPYETGLAYGQTNAILYPVLGALANFFKVEFEKVDIIPDFTAEKDSCDITLKAKIPPIHLIRAGISFLIDMAKGAYSKSTDKNDKQNNNKTNKEGVFNNG